MTHGNLLLTHTKQITQKNGVNFVIWCYWAGPMMTQNRLTSFELMKSSLNVPVFLITPENIHNIALPDHPFHPALKHLSAVHQSDYIRSYCLHHYGGGWHDIKATAVSFEPVWNDFKDSNVYLIGRPEHRGGPARVHDKEGRWMPDCWEDLVSVTAWVARPYTPFSQAIYTDLHAFLDEHATLLALHPAKHPREKKIVAKNTFHRMLIRLKNLFTGRSHHYPLPWTLFGNIFHPHNYAFRNHILRTLPQDHIKNAGVYHR